MNNINDPAKLKAGQKLKIPDKPGVSIEQQSGSAGTVTEYIVIKNDTLFSIAKRNNITVNDLRKFNGFSDSYMLKAGDKLRIPTETKTTGITVDFLPDFPFNPAANPAPKSGGIQWPVTVRNIFKAEGKLKGGVIITSYAAEAVRSLITGIVKSAGPYLSYKNVVIVQSSKGYLYIYGGCERLSVKQGDRVGPGTELGKLGTSKEPQLLFMVSRNNVFVDTATAPRD
jgi:murein DD-endopeptidase MepM/ murein hydrolase activator NlpD